jgi:hypothetical protein
MRPSSEALHSPMTTFREVGAAQGILKGSDNSRRAEAMQLETQSRGGAATAPTNRRKSANTRTPSLVIVRHYLGDDDRAAAALARLLCKLAPGGLQAAEGGRA